MNAPRFVEVLGGSRYVRLTTYRRSGRGVATPVWVAGAGGSLYVITGRGTGKAKRIRNDPRVDLAPSDFRGRPKGGDVRAVARLMDEAESAVADRALQEKYGWQYRLFRLVERLRGSADEIVFLELRPADDGAAG